MFPTSSHIEHTAAYPDDQRSGLSISETEPPNLQSSYQTSFLLRTTLPRTSEEAFEVASGVVEVQTDHVLYQQNQLHCSSVCCYNPDWNRGHCLVDSIAVFHWVVEAGGLAVASVAVADWSYLSAPLTLLEMMCFFLAVPTVGSHQKKTVAIAFGYRPVLANDCWQAGDLHLGAY